MATIELTRDRITVHKVEIYDGEALHIEVSAGAVTGPYALVLTTAPDGTTADAPDGFYEEMSAGGSWYVPHSVTSGMAKDRKFYLTIRAPNADGQADTDVVGLAEVRMLAAGRTTLSLSAGASTFPMTFPITLA